MLQNQVPVRRWKQWLVLPMLGGISLAACRTTDVGPVAAPSDLPPPVSVTYQSNDKDARRLAIKEVMRLDSLQTGGKPVPGAKQMISSAPANKEGLATFTVSYTRAEKQPLSSTGSGVYIYVEQMPKLPGKVGMAAIVQAIQDNIVYPHDAAGRQLPEGRSFVSFVVNTDGTLKDVNVVKSGGEAYDLAVIDAIHKLPRFEPGRQAGKAVAVSYTVPIKFEPKP